jgi:hypothetical protein
MIELDELFNEITPFIQKVPAGSKLCNGCRRVKLLSEFNNRKDRGSSDSYGKVARCRECTTTASHAWYYADHEKTKQLARATQYRRRHSSRITDEEAAQLADSNLGYCDLCTDYGTVVVDHDHMTEKRRGFLCSRCNFALGGFQDSAELLQKAAEYIRYYRSKK